jgi:hypothetical protein
MQRSASRAASDDFPGRMRSLMKSGSCCVEEVHKYLLELFQTADLAELDSLLSSPEELMLATNYVHSVIDDLDERRSAAADELHGVLGPTAGPIIVGWPE